MTTESDRELLELAAKAATAAGMPIIQSEAGPQVLERRLSDGTECYRLWAPQTEDGDALRLAVALGLVVDCSRPSAALPFTRHDYILSEGDDPARATRRAITRAAASIGRGEG